MKIIFILLKFFYIWSSYHLLFIKTYGYTDYKLSSLILSLSLFLSAIMSYWYKSKYYMLIPIIPFIFFLHKDTEIDKLRHKRKKIYIKN
jgi:hypothetical protein